MILTISSSLSSWLKTELRKLCSSLLAAISLNFFEEAMMAQNNFCMLYTTVFILTVCFLPSQIALGRKFSGRNIQEEERSPWLSRRALPKWIEELPDSVPQWMKTAASNYRGSPQQIVCAVKKLAKALNDMRAARARNCDDYFRCRGSKDAAQCGAYAASFATQIR